MGRRDLRARATEPGAERKSELKRDGGGDVKAPGPGNVKLGGEK